MTASTDDDFDDEAYPRTVSVPVAFDPFGKPVAWIDADPEAVGQWDERCWRNYP